MPYDPSNVVILCRSKSGEENFHLMKDLAYTIFIHEIVYLIFKVRVFSLIGAWKILSRPFYVALI